MRIAFVLGLAAVSVVPILAQERPNLLRLVGQTVPGRVIAVADGDTVRVRLNGDGRVIRVRLEGIDAPERGEPFNVQARNATRVMLFEKAVQVRATDVDRYDRLVARITVEGRDSSVELVGAGLACHYTRYSSDQTLAAAQIAARQAGRGFWIAGGSRPACTARLNPR